MINVTQNLDGSLSLMGATSLTIMQVDGGVVLKANDVLVLPGGDQQSKIDKAKVDIAAAVVALTKAGGDLA